MHHLDDLPKRHRNHTIESKAESAFQGLISRTEDFVLQNPDRKDYGTDFQIEVVDDGSATNVRMHVQLKGTEAAINADGSISVEIRRSNLNYLLMQPYAFFVCYHVPSDTLRFCSADAVVRQYEHSGRNWSEQHTLTITFYEILTAARLKSLATLARSGAASSRNVRVMQTTAPLEKLPDIVRTSLPYLHVPEDKTQAAAMLSSLFDSGEDRTISAAFEEFASVLCDDRDAMTACYMAEINLGMSGQNGNARRILDGIAHLTSQLNKGRHHRASLYYSIGNGFSALDRQLEAVDAYETALRLLTEEAHVSLLACCYKNLGSSFEKLGNREKAASCFREALRHCPHLSEAHLAIGLQCLHDGSYQEALDHFDQVVVTRHTLGKSSLVSGWRINALFNLGDGRGAYREISTLLGDAADEAWIWPWCARQIASFGRASLENARLSIPYWIRYLKVHPHCANGVRELLLNKLYLRTEGRDPGVSYPVFKKEFEENIQYVEDEAAALLWDRMGHWAQDSKDWEEAERCFRRAYDLAGGHYGYCLGTALNALDRPEDSLPVLLLMAEKIQPDDLSWFQVAIAYEKLGRVRESISAYQKVISLNPNYDLAWFNMGGVHWNSGEREEASQVWKAAVDRFPDHELATRLRRDLPFVLR